MQASALAKPKSPAKWKIRIFYGAVFKAVIRIDKLSLNRCAIGRKCWLWATDSTIGLGMRVWNPFLGHCLAKNSRFSFGKDESWTRLWYVHVDKYLHFRCRVSFAMNDGLCNILVAPQKCICMHGSTTIYWLPYHTGALAQKSTLSVGTIRFQEWSPCKSDRVMQITLKNQFACNFNC